MDELSRYLLENFGIKLSLHSLDQQGNIPLYLKGNFEFFEGALFGQKVVWAKLKRSTEFTPDQLKKQGTQIKQIIQSPVVFVFEQLESWLRKRLIEKHIGFVLPFKQLYIPELLLQWNDIVKDQLITVNEGKKLSPPAQLTVLYHLQVISLEDKPFLEIADLLQYSAMTITRLVKELQSHQLITIEGSKEKTIKFIYHERFLWEKCQSLFSSPVLEYWLTDQLIDDENFRAAGDTALSVYTMISETEQSTYAIGKEEFRRLKNSGKLYQLDKRYGTLKIEVWHYNPVILSQSSEVDRLSLYLSLQDVNDERLQSAREELINHLVWYKD